MLWSEIIQSGVKPPHSKERLYPHAVMSFKFYTVPIQDGGSAAAELNGFLRSHKVLCRVWDTDDEASRPPV
jgi:hypothetical protein